MSKEKKLRQPQHQDRQPGREDKMKPRPKSEDEKHPGSGKLQNRVALITGGDSGIRRGVAIAFAKEEADVAVVYLEEHRDAKETQRLVEEHGRNCLLIDVDIGDEKILSESGQSNGERTQQDRHPGQQTLPTSIRRIQSRKSRQNSSSGRFARTSFQCFF